MQGHMAASTCMHGIVFGFGGSEGADPFGECWAFRRSDAIPRPLGRSRGMDLLGPQASD